MKNYLIGGAIGLVIGLLIAGQCSTGKQVVVEHNTIDTITHTVYDTIIEEHIDTITQFVDIPKLQRDTLYKEITVPAENTEYQETGLYSYNEFYKDSTYQVAGNIQYKGEITEHDQMLIQRKEEITFIPTTRTIYRTRDIIKTEYKHPKFLAGTYMTTDGFSLEQVGVNVTYVDNKYRQYTVGKSVNTPLGLQFEFRGPIFWK
jgi:hypothetical protein